MVFKMVDYIVKHSNKVSELLDSCNGKGLFLSDTKIMLDYRDGVLWCTFFMNYTLSCNDMLALHDVFAGFWWCVSPCFAEGEYRLAVCLKGVEI